MEDLITDREELGMNYAAADLFVFPSLYDNAPLVVREAASMGTPSIIPIGSTASEIIIDKKNGFLAEPTPESYSDLIIRLTKDKSMIREAGMNARNDLVRGWNDVMEEIVDRYEKLIKRFSKK